MTYDSYNNSDLWRPCSPMTVMLADLRTVSKESSAITSQVNTPALLTPTPVITTLPAEEPVTWEKEIKKDKDKKI